MVKHHSSLVCFCCLIWICLSWQRPLHAPDFKRDESVKVETIKDPKAVKQFLVNPKKDSEEFRPVPLPDNFSRYDNNVNDNFISLQELINTTGAKRNAKEAFKDADKNGDGKISPEEFQGAPWTLNISEILVNLNASKSNLTENLEEDLKRYNSLKIENALDSDETEEKIISSFDTGMEDSSKSRMEDSSESQQVDSSKSRMEDSSESQQVDSSKSRMEDSSESQQVDSSKSRMEDSSESQQVDSSENRLDDSSESILEDSLENILEDISESVLEDSSDISVEDSFESILGDSSHISIGDSSENSVEESTNIRIENSSENSMKDSPESRTMDNSDSDTQSWNLHHS